MRRAARNTHTQIISSAVFRDDFALATIKSPTYTTIYYIMAHKPPLNASCGNKKCNPKILLIFSFVVKWYFIYRKNNNNYEGLKPARNVDELCASTKIILRIFGLFEK